MKKVGILIIMIGVVGMVFTAKGFFGRESVQEKVTFPGEQFEHIVVEGNYGNVTVRPTEDRDINVSWKGSIPNLDTFENLVTVKENNSELKVNIGNQNGFNFSFFNFNMFKKLQVLIELPQKEFSSLVVKNDVGNTHINNIVVDHLTAETDVAKMTIEDVVTKSTVVETDVGNVTLKNIVGNLHAESDVGNIEIINEEITHDMKLISDVGKIELSLPEIPDNVTFDGHSSVGKVTVFGEKGSFITTNSKYLVSMTTDVGKITVGIHGR